MDKKVIIAKVKNKLSLIKKSRQPAGEIKLSVKEMLDLLELTVGKKFRDNVATYQLGLRELKSEYILTSNRNELMIKVIYPDGKISWIELDNQNEAAKYFKNNLKI